MEIVILHKQGMSNRHIAKLLGISRNTVKKYLASLEVSYKKRAPKETKLEPYHDYLKQRVDAARPEWLPATVLFIEIKKQGYPRVK
jgi:transposase